MITKNILLQAINDYEKGIALAKQGKPIFQYLSTGLCNYFMKKHDIHISKTMNLVKDYLPGTSTVIDDYPAFTNNDAEIVERLQSRLDVLNELYHEYN